MSNRYTLLLNRYTLSVFFILVFQWFSQLTHAQSGGIAPGETGATNPKHRETIVSATVPDFISPSAPFLISPEDESLLNDATPTFVWQQSTDNVGISYYQLYLDGALLHNNIPTSNTTNAAYTLTYDSNTGQYSLTPTALIADGAHTWRVMVYDAAGNSNTSATWDFIIDTQAPAFVITSIGPIPTEISAQDISTVPEEVIELEDNEPEFVGTGEANATVQVTVQIPDQANQIINFTIDGSGNWSFQLGILPRDEIITLNFVITDSAGNISVITDLKILIIQQVIIFPPTPEPTPSVSPGATPVASPISATPPPTTTPPIIVIPILPPKEIAEIIKQEIIAATPVIVTDILELIPEEIRTVISDLVDILAPAGTLIATVALPAISILTLLLQFGKQFTVDILVKLLQAIGLLPPKEPQGMVFDSETNKPVAFALLTITSVQSSLSEKIIETIVTDVNGIYQGIQLPKGQYILNVNHQDYTFPTTKKRPSYATIQEYYKGEVFELESNNRQPLFLIPVDRIEENKTQQTLKKRFLYFLHKLRLKDVFWPLFIISIIITLFYPTWINFFVLVLYVLVLLRRMYVSLKKPILWGYVRDISGESIENATVRISDPLLGQMVALLTTDKHGFFALYAKPAKYQIQITKVGLRWTQAGSSLGYEEINTLKEQVFFEATMEKTAS